MKNLIGLDGMSLSSYFDPKRAAECDREHKCPVVALSRSMGANGSKVAELLADSLTVPCFGYSMLDGIVKEAKSDKFLMSLIDERSPTPLEDWIHGLFSKGEISRAAFYRRLIKTTLAISKTGGVIIGRGAHLILSSNPKVFRVRVEGSLEVRIQRVAEREKIKTKKAKDLIAKTDDERKRYVKELYKRFPHKRGYYDLVVNSDNISPHAVVDIIIYTMEQMGYYVPGSEQAATVLNRSKQHVHVV